MIATVIFLLKLWKELDRRVKAAYNMFWQKNKKLPKHIRRKEGIAMAWYDASIQMLPVGKSFTRSEIIACLRKNNPALSENSFQWAIGRMVKTGALTRPGFNLYLRLSEEPQRRYHALYSDDALKLIKLVDAEYPNIQFTVFESSLLNEFLNHLVAQNTIFLQVEKDAALFVFRFLQEASSREVLYKPSKKGFSLYWEKDCIPSA